MADKSISGTLEKFFSKSDKSDWKKIAMSETNGKDPFEILSWRGKDDILFLPYYTASDVADLQYLKAFEIPAAKNHNAANRTWVNLSLVVMIDESSANQLALHQLSSGADGIVFDLRKHHQPDANILMKEIVWPYCPVSFYVKADNNFSETLQPFIKKSIDPASVRGALYWESIPKKNNLHFYFNLCPNFQAVGVFISASTPANEICNALVEGVNAFETFASQGNAERVFGSIAFSLPTDPSFLQSAAKLKALRMLWYQVAHAYGINNYKTGDLHINARSEAVVDGAYAPQENMLKASFSAMAAIAGGCNSLAIETQSEPPLMPRFAKNVSAILKEESFFDQVADPLAGAYAYDVIVDALARKAWELFQLKCQDA